MNDDWFDLAECRTPPEGTARQEWVAVFVRDATGKPGVNGTDYSRARKVCKRCPVTSDCLEYALAEQITYGMWGGLSPRQRRGMYPKNHGGPSRVTVAVRKWVRETRGAA